LQKPVFTKREHDVLRLIGAGHAGKAIARQLGIAEFTVRKHRANIAAKLGCRSAAGVVAYAVREAAAGIEPRPSSELSALTMRERNVVEMIAQGMTSKQIAKRVGISPLTVRKHRANAMAKLDVHDVGTLIRRVMRG
jgi:DNA-binding CsgD family transcriptional regulator